ncbi:MAG: zinc-binding dehydrogenase [Acidobacteriota bacterium]
MAPLGRLICRAKAGRGTPVVARTFPLEQAAEAHRFIQARQKIGKVVLPT